MLVRDPAGVARAWGSVHDRASGRMLFLHVVERGLPEPLGRACSDLLVEWAVGQAREVGAARGLRVQQIDTGAFAGDERQARWLRAAGFARVREWWQMTRAVRADEAGLVPSPDRWSGRGVTFRLAEGEASVNELAAPFDMSQPAISKHIKVLENAGLVSRGKDAQRRPVKIEAMPLADAVGWLETYRKFWEKSYERLDNLLEELQSFAPKGGKNN